VQYRVIRVHPTSLTVARAVGRCPQGSPRALAWPGGEEVRGSTSVAVPVDGTGTVSVAPVMATPVQQHWFINIYITAYIQVQYMVIGVHPTGLTIARGVGRCPTEESYVSLNECLQELKEDSC
jgi:hypothetical protein